MIKSFGIMLAVLALAEPVSASECPSAISSFNSAVDEVATRLKRYASCIGESRGRDDCSSEFRKMKNAQDEFEFAVSALSLDNCLD
jgi:hypothetical protein